MSIISTLVIVTVGCGRADISKPTTGTTVIAFGDSLTQGVGATVGEDYVSQLERNLGYRVINAGVSGNTSSDARLRFDTDVLAKDPRVVIILLGGNDALQNVSPDVTFANLTYFIDTLQERGTGVILVGIRGGLQNAAYKRRFPELAKEKNIAYVPDILDGIFGEKDLMSDSIHPNAKGYSLFVPRIAPHVDYLIH